MAHERKTTANRPSQSDQEYVRNSRGELIRNVAYIPREHTTTITQTNATDDFDPGARSTPGEMTVAEKEELFDTVVDDFASRRRPWYTKKPFDQLKEETEPFLADMRNKMNDLIDKQDAQGLFTLAHDVAFSQERSDFMGNSYVNYKNPEYKKMDTEFRALFAQAVDNAMKITGQQPDVVNIPDDTPINGSTPLGNFESNSREWLEVRQSGMGASDYAVIADKESRWHEQNMNRVHDSKVKKYTDADVNKHAHSTSDEYYRNAMHQGTVLEDYTAMLAAQQLPAGERVMHNKSTHRFPGTHAQINYDYLLDRDGDGKPDGVFEIKTAKNFRYWGDTADGIDGLPQNYRAQVLVQAYTLGADHGALGVLGDHNQVRLYQFEMTDDLKKEARGIIEAGDALFDVWQMEKNNISEQPPF